MAVIKKYKKKNGQTAYQFDHYLGVDPKTGKKRRTTRRGFATPKEARLALARLEAGVDEAPAKNSQQKKYTTFNDIFKLWYETYKLTVKETTLEKTNIHFKNHILPAIGHLVIDQISYEDCQKAVNQWSTETSICRIYKSYANKIFEFAMKKEIISKNPMALTDIPKRKAKNKSTDQSYYSKEELATFLGWMKKHRPESEYVLVHLLAYTGIRKGELAALVWDDVDFEKGTLKVNKAVVLIEKLTLTSPKTESSIRTISLDCDTLEILRKWKISQKKNLFKRGIIAQPDQQQLIVANKINTFIYQAYPQTVMRHYPGTQLTPHKLRHTHATLLLNGGVSITDVQRRLGHSSAATTMSIYAHATKDDSHVADAVSRIFMG